MAYRSGIARKSEDRAEINGPPARLAHPRPQLSGQADDCTQVDIEQREQKASSVSASVFTSVDPCGIQGGQNPPRGVWHARRRKPSCASTLRRGSSAVPVFAFRAGTVGVLILKEDYNLD
jgi:hypothetical protein